MDIISPMLDVMFKRMFSMPSNASMLCDFLSAYIDFKAEKPTNVTLINTEIKRTPDEKKSVMDLRVQLNDTTEVDVEIQLRKQKNFEERATYYLAKIYSDQLDPSMSYTKIHRCVSLCLLDFLMSDKPGFCRTVLLRDDDGETFTPTFELVCVELPKIRRMMDMAEITDKRVQWGKLLTASTEEELNRVRNASNNPAIDKAVLTVKELSADKKMRLEAEARMKDIRDRMNYRETDFAEGKEEGIKEGIKEGIEIERKRSEARMEHMRNSLKKRGFDEETINSIINGKD